MIEVTALCKQFEVRERRSAFALRSTTRRVTAVNDVSFVARDGEVTGLLGPNGAGKTTTLRMLSTLLTPDSGSARIDSHDIAQGRAQAFLHHRMIKRHVQHLADGQLLLAGPGQQVGNMFSARTNPFCPQQTATALFGVHMHQATVAQHHPAAALVFKAHLSHHILPGGQISMAQAKPIPSPAILINVYTLLRARFLAADLK